MQWRLPIVAAEVNERKDGSLVDVADEKDFFLVRISALFCSDRNSVRLEPDTERLNVGRLSGAQFELHDIMEFVKELVQLGTALGRNVMSSCVIQFPGVNGTFFFGVLWSDVKPTVVIVQICIVRASIGVKDAFSDTGDTRFVAQVKRSA